MKINYIYVILSVVLIIIIYNIKLNRTDFFTSDREKSAIMAFNDDINQNNGFLGINTSDDMLKMVFDKLEKEGLKFLGNKPENVYTKINGYSQVNLTKADLNATVGAVLNIINTKTGLHFRPLDTQIFRKEMDTQGNQRYVIELFIVENSSTNVNVYVKDIAFIYYKLANGTSFFSYIRSLKDSPIDKGPDKILPNNPHQNAYIKIQNDLYLNAPYKTTDLNILFDDQVIAELKSEYKSNTVAPVPLCFDKTSGNMKSMALCETYDIKDSPVQHNEDCPFYKKNTNYSNSFGSVNQDGRCELPVNMKLIGYKNASDDPVNQPLCYNCRIGEDGSPNSIGPCCDEQKDPKLYPNLSSPDYMFNGDQYARYNARSELEKKGLFWEAYGNDALNNKQASGPQKQPVFAKFIGL